MMEGLLEGDAVRSSTYRPSLIVGRGLTTNWQCGSQGSGVALAGMPRRSSLHV